ncbi:MAG: methyltransferase small domain protein, partial [Myxococcaceae bacterium]|nr:methyltransferase small domain protein [Myxococcaceae bacterium]
MRLDEGTMATLSALDVSLRAATASAPTATHVKIVEQLARPEYVKVNKALESIGGKWSKKLGTHVFDGDARAQIEELINVGEITTNREIGYFPTPQKLAEQLVEMSMAHMGWRVLEPSAGDGAIVRPLLATGAYVDVIERDAGRRELLAKIKVEHKRRLTIFTLDDFMEYD